MKTHLIKPWFLTVMLCFFTCIATAQTPVSQNGQLQVIGLKLCNQYGNPIQLRGMSTHGIQWYGWGSCLTEASLDALAYDWGADVLRISLYVQDDGYETDPAGFTAQVNRLIEEATERGMYALVDWHQLDPGDPNVNLAMAKTFFTAIANQHKNKNNIIYDVCNEPNGVTWARIKTYADQIIPVIRAIDSDAVVLVGTHAWGSMGVSDGRSAQDIVSNPLSFTNIMYTFHFYAKDHQAQYLNELNWASDRLPVFVTEFGSQEATGDGPNDFTMTQQFIDLMQTKKISWCNWNYSDDFRSGAVWTTGTCSAGPWTTARLKPAGAWIRQRMLSPADNFPGGTPGCVPVSASADDGNVPANVLDGNLATRWSASGNPQWIQFCLSSVQTVSGVKIAFYNGNVRASNFDVLVSQNGTSWTNAALGLQSSGTSVNLETFTFPAQTAKYVRIVGHGNNVNLWNSYTEVQIVQQTNVPPTVSISSPAGGATYTAPASVAITATAADSDGSISKVEFYQGTTKLGESLTSPYTYTWSNVAAGNYALTAKATDNGGSAVTSSAVNITVSTAPACTPVSASTDDGNVPANVLDNNLATRWSASGNPQWIQFCLSSVQTVTGVQIAFYNGNVRTSYFDVQVSQNGTSWTNAATGLQSSGTSVNLETFSFAPQSAKYVRILGHGNSVNAWNSYTEVKIVTGSGLQSIAAAKLSEPEASKEAGLIVSPNPFTGKLSVQFQLPSAGQAELAMFDMNGKMTAVLQKGHLPAGKHSVEYNGSHLVPGVYIVKLQYRGLMISKKVQKM